MREFGRHFYCRQQQLLVDRPLVRAWIYSKSLKTHQHPCDVDRYYKTERGDLNSPRHNFRNSSGTVVQVTIQSFISKSDIVLYFVVNDQRRPRLVCGPEVGYLNN